MKYKRLSNEELSKYKYPNLLAEIIEIGYSICTIADHMGLPGRRNEDDPEVWEKLRGNIDFYGNEIIGLSGLFCVECTYLFDKKLRTMDDKPLAYWRWHDRNEKRKQEEAQRQLTQEIQDMLKKRPELMDLFKELITLNDEQIKEFSQLFMEKKNQ